MPILGMGVKPQNVRDAIFLFFINKQIFSLCAWSFDAK